MCYGCTRCGKCRPKEDPPLDKGQCPVCEHINPPDVTRCEKCGMPLPKPPGSEVLLQQTSSGN